MEKLIGTHIRDTHSNNIFLIQKFINSGSFGNVFQCIDENKNKFALKYPINNNIKNKDKDTFYNEIKVYDHLYSTETDNSLNSSNNKSVCIPLYKIIECDKIQKKLILIELLGSNLGDIVELFPKKRLPLRELILVTIKLISVIKYVHNKGIIHQDIKPENFIFGVEEDLENIQNNNKLYCIDFGLSRIVKSNDKKQKSVKSFMGTLRYASLAAHNHLLQSCRDDLESIMYMVIYLFKGKLPWMNQKIKKSVKSTKYKLIQKIKEETTPEDLTKGLPVEFLDFFKYIKNLEYAEKPSYSSLKNMFIRLYLEKYKETGFSIYINIDKKK